MAVAGVADAEQWHGLRHDLPLSELKARLKAIWSDLIERNSRDLELDDDHGYQELSLQLADGAFVRHDNKDVRLLAACCLMELFKIYCPSSPFVNASNENSLIASTLKFFYSTAAGLRRLKSESAPAFNTMAYFVRNLIQTDLILVCQDNPEAGDLAHEFFKCLLAIAHNVSIWSWEESEQQMLRTLANAMSKVVEEAFSLIDSRGLSLILEHLVKPKKESEPLAHKLAVQFVLDNASHLEMFIHKLLQEMLVLSSGDTATTRDLDSSDEDADRLQRHAPLSLKDDLLLLLVHELYKLERAFVNPVLPMLELRLLSRSERDRRRACRLLSKLFCETDSSLIERQPGLWQAFIGRVNDVSPAVRGICIEAVPHLLRSNAELRASLVAILRTRSTDPDDSIRDRVIAMVGELATTNLKSVPEDLIAILVDRSRDKSHAVRRGALASLSKIYNAYVSETELCIGEASSSQYCIMQCMNAVMQMYLFDNALDRISVERHFKSWIVPITSNAKRRMQIFLWCFCSFTNVAAKAFVEMLKTEFHIAQLTSQIVEMLNTESASDHTQEWMYTRSKTLASYFPQPDKSAVHLKKFFDTIRSQKQSRQLLTGLLNKDCSSVNASELLKKLLRKQDASTHAAQKTETDGAITYRGTVKALLERCSPLIFDKESVTHLLRMVSANVGASSTRGLSGQGFLESQMKGFQLVNVVTFYLLRTVEADAISEYLLASLESVSCCTDCTLVAICLQIVENSTSLLNNLKGRQLFKILSHIFDLTESVNPKIAKLATKCLLAVRSSGANAKVKQYVAAIVSRAADIQPVGDDAAAAKLASFGQVVKTMALACSADTEPIVLGKLAQFLRLEDRKAKRSYRQSMSKWTEYELATSLTKLKLGVIKCLCQYLLGLLTNEESAAQPIVETLYSIVFNDGDLQQTGLIAAGEMAQLRLCAAKCLLRVAKHRVYLRLITTEKLQGIACLICDPCSEVRTGFLNKLHRGLIKLKLPLEFMALFAYSPEAPGKPSFQQNARNYLQQNVARRRQFLSCNRQQAAADRSVYFSLLPENVVPYAVHLLAHDPDFESASDLKQLGKIRLNIRFLLEPILAKEENFSWMRTMLEKIRAANDALEPDNEAASLRLHAVSDLALGVLVTKARKFTISDHPFEPQLPKKLYVFPKTAAANAEFSSLPPALKFSPPRNAQAVQQGLIPNKRLRPKARRRKDSLQLDDEFAADSHAAAGRPASAEHCPTPPQSPILPSASSPRRPPRRSASACSSSSSSSSGSSRNSAAIDSRPGVRKKKLRLSSSGDESSGDGRRRSARSRAQK